MGTEVIVIGSGPSGSTVARIIASAGYSVKVYEEHGEIGIPSHCAGIISVEGFKRLGIPVVKEFLLQEIYGGRVYSPCGENLHIKDKRPRAYAIDRIALDKYLANRAIDAGAEVIIETKVTKINRRDGVATGVTTSLGEESAKIVIDAEGASRNLLRAFDPTVPPTQMLVGLNTEIEAELEANMVEVWLGQTIAPGFFSWVIPIGSKARIGLAAHSDALIRLKRFLLKRLGKQACDAQFRAGLVLVDGPIRKLNYPGMLVIGDTAGHVKPTTGGGIVMGGICAKEAADTAIRALQTGNTSESGLFDYPYLVTKKYGSEFKRMLRLRRLIDRLDDSRVDVLFRALKNERLDQLAAKLIESGDMDFQGTVIRSALSNPRIISVLIRCLGFMALTEL